MEGGDLDRRLPRPIGCQRGPAGCEMQGGAAHARDYAADAPIAQEPIPRARPQPVFALAEWQLVDEARHECGRPVAPPDRLTPPELKVVGIAAPIGCAHFREEDDLL